MSEENYQEYKKERFRNERREENHHRGKMLLILGVIFLAYLLFILPYDAGNVGEMRGDEVIAGKEYHRIRVCYIDQLRILNTKTDTDGSLYCIASFLDRDQEECILCLTPGKDEKLAEHVKLSSSFEKEFDLTVNGYFQLRYLEDLPSSADSFYSVYTRKYAEDGTSNLLGLNADYLCKGTENYTLAVICRPGIPLGSLVAGLIGVFYGSYLLIRNPKRKPE